MIEDYYTSGWSTTRATVTQDNGGARVETFASNISSFSGYLQKLSGREQIWNKREQEYTTYRFYCDISNDIAYGDILTDSDSNTYNIISVDNPGGQNHHYECEVTIRG